MTHEREPFLLSSNVSTAILEAEADVPNANDSFASVLRLCRRPQPLHAQSSRSHDVNGGGEKSAALDLLPFHIPFFITVYLFRLSFAY